MADKERTSILELIGKSAEFDIALMTTFNFEIHYFERAILNQLSAQNVRSISLFIDSEELASAIREVDSCHLGRRYMVNPIRMDSAFHPKVILLLGQKSARLIVGSSNIKTSGYTVNNEVFAYIDYSQKHPEYQNVICDAITFFLKLDRLSIQLDNDLIREIRDLSYYKRVEPNTDLALLYNLDKSILSQVQNYINEPIKEIKIAVPYYDPTLSAVSEIKEIFPDTKISVFIQQGTSTFPLVYNKRYAVIDQVNIFDYCVDNNSKAFYHGKVFLFKGAHRSFFLYGSANCTQAALTKTFGDGGNIECDFITAGNTEDLDAFFNNFHICYPEVIKSNPMTFEKRSNVFFSFRYGEVATVMELHFSCVHGIKPIIELGDFVLEYSVEDDELIAVVPEEIIDSLPEIFEVVFKYNGKEETVRCWTIIPDALKNYRNRTVDSSSIDAFDIDSDGHKYIQDRINFLNAEQTCLPEIEEYKKTKAYYNQVKLDSEEGAGDDEDFIIDVEIPEEYSFAYKTHKKLVRIRDMYLSSLLSRYRDVFSDNQTDSKDAKDEDESKTGKESPERKKRKPDPEEKSFERFIKGKVRGMMNSQYIDVVEPEHLLTLVQAVMEIFSKYKYVDLFDSVYMVETRAALFKAILSKDFSSSEITNIDYIVLLECYKALAENYFAIMAQKRIEQRESADSINRELLLAMEKKNSVREKYREHISDLMKSEDPGLKASYVNIFSNYIESLFGYKSYDMLVEYIQNRYSLADVILSGTEMTISALSSNIRERFVPDIEILREIRNYSWNVKKVDTVKIIIRNRAEPAYIGRVEHFINYRSRTDTFSIIRKDGTLFEESKPEYINL